MTLDIEDLTYDELLAFTPGDRVCFTSRAGETVTGLLVRHNRKNALDG